ncbi:MAG: ABC transporter substrate-binding protein [Armatimonadota bacterium]
MNLVRVAIGLLAVGLFGCGNFSTQAKPGATREYVWLTRYDVKTLDPAALQDWTSGKVLSYLYPSIGTMCKIGCDKPSVFSLTVKPSKFSNGDPVTAEDIRFTLERCLETEIHSSVGNQFAAQIRGSKDFADGKTAHPEGIKITDGSHLFIILDRMDSTYGEKLNNNAFGVLNHKLVGLKKPITDALLGYGAGNWTMDCISPGTEWTLKPRGDGERLKFRFSGDSANRRSIFDTGGADYAMFAAHEIGVVKGHKNLTKGGPTTLVYLQMNPKTKPSLTMQVRYEIGSIIHSNLDFAKVLGDHVTPAISFLELSGLPQLPSNALSRFNLTGKDHFEITFAEIGMQNPSVEAIVAALRKAGMDVQGRAMPSGAMLEANSRGEIAMLFTGWQPDYDGPLNTIPMLFHSKSSENHSGYNNPRVDRLINLAQTGFDTNKNIQEASLMIEGEAPCIPLYVQRDLVLMRREPPKP